MQQSIGEETDRHRILMRLQHLFEAQYREEYKQKLEKQKRMRRTQTKHYKKIKADFETVLHKKNATPQEKHGN